MPRKPTEDDLETVANAFQVMEDIGEHENLELMNHLEHVYDYFDGMIERPDGDN